MSPAKFRAVSSVISKLVSVDVTTIAPDDVECTLFRGTVLLLVESKLLKTQSSLSMHNGLVACTTVLKTSSTTDDEETILSRLAAFAEIRQSDKSFPWLVQ